MTRKNHVVAAQVPDGAADIARRFGVTIKALRLYEDAGLIAPLRDGRGWRTYGQKECERLHLILVLRQFGLTIAQIGALLGQGAPDLGEVLTLQHRALSEQRARIDDALGLIDRAHALLARGEPLAVTTLAELARVEPARLIWSSALAALSEKIFTPAQKERLADVAPQDEASWNAIYAELAEIVDGSPDTERACALGARASALIARMTGGDDDMRHALTRFWHVGFADPALSRQLPMDEKGWQFLGKAMAAHARKGEGE